MSDARVSIEVHHTSVSPSRTCINSVVEHIVCTENIQSVDIFIIEFSCSALSVSLVYLLFSVFNHLPSFLLLPG